jgi:succinate-semialdehyde dehydrogenase / glutarate-semialdehyde dehydrogenase
MDFARDAFVAGTWQRTQHTFAVRDPFDNAVIADVADCGEPEVARAIDAAHAAFASWRAMPAPARGAILAKLAAAMTDNQARLAEICTRENGKPLGESIAEVTYATSFIHWFAGEAERIYGETIPATNAGDRIVVTREPVGPCALITPWNFPYAMLTRKLGAALAAGCTVVCKPAAQTPLSALALAQLCERAGVPAGVVNAVPSTHHAEVGAQLLASPKIRKISFTGSTRVGQDLMRQAANDVKRISLELGGNAPFVVLADADLEQAVAAAMIAKFRNTGQSCVAANRFILEAPIASAFTQQLLAKVRALKLGRGMDKPDLGPLIDDNAVVKIKRLVDDAIARGATLLHGESPSSRLVGPIVLGDVTPAMAVWREEIFGPVVTLRIAHDEADAIDQANDTDAGLVAYLMTRDGARQARVAEAIEAGMVGVNRGVISDPAAPFGGVKQSGFGREGGIEGIEEYLDTKYIALTN